MALIYEGVRLPIDVHEVTQTPICAPDGETIASLITLTVRSAGS